MTLGTTHVAVGFVDLGTLREARIDATAAAHPGPLRWVGVEASPYAVAKTAVVDAMMRAGATTDAVLQVWYSAAWSHATAAAFAAAVDELLARGGADNAHGATERNVEVERLLRKWQRCEVPLATARKQWLEGLGHMWRQIGNFTHAADRDALCTYVLTGQLLDAEVGSVCMFALPDPPFGERSNNESVFQSIPVEQLWARRQQTPDIVAAATAHLHDGIARLMARVADGSVTIALQVDHLELSTPASLARIAALAPASMSWSNVCDYI
jgi:hypothetical protein